MEIVAYYIIIQKGQKVSLILIINNITIKNNNTNINDICFLLQLY